MALVRALKTIGGIILLIFLVFVQVSLINILPSPWNNFSVVLAALFFVVLLIDYHLGFWATVVMALFLEVYSPAFWGAILAPLLLAVVLINFLFNLLFTNRSLYSLLILSGLGIIFFRFLNIFYLKVFYWLNLTNWDIGIGEQLAPIVWQLFLVLAVLFLVFLPLRLFSKRFRSVFLVEGRR